MVLSEVPTIIEAINAASEAVDRAASDRAQGPAAESQPAAEPSASEPAAASEEPSPEPAPEPTPSPSDAADVAAPTPEPAAASEVPAPSEEPEAASAPLFGAPDPATEPASAPLFGASPEAAVQDSHAHKADLFGAQVAAGSDDDVATSAPRMDPVVNKPTGARDESSVLFSLSALTSAAAASSGSAGTAESDDSGLIDLNALRDQEAKSNEQDPAEAAPTGGILDAAPLLGSVVDPNLHQLHASEPPPKRNTGMIIGIVFGVVGMVSAVVLLVIVMTRDDPPPPAPVPVPTATDTVATTTEAPTATAPTTAPSSAAAAPPTGAPSATAVATGKPNTKGGWRRPPHRGKKPGSAKTPKPASTKKRPKKNKCNCPPGDLACNMACAVK
nr:MAG: hypothetical protein CSA75_00835 [Sorangium cellulosum]